MLTPAQITAVSRNIIGHMTTDPAVRTALDIDPASTGAGEKIAAAINAATSFSPAVTAADVPAIMASIKTIGAATDGLEPVNVHANVLFFKTQS
jgi:hypothetical protein